MKNEDILACCDHTLLSPTATKEEIFTLCEDAITYHTASVCIPPCYVKIVREKFPNLNICTVIGFPHGNTTTSSKEHDTKEAIQNGANEIDMVINLSMLKNKDYDYVLNEIKSLRKICTNDIILKVIIETCYLDEQEKIKMCELVTKAKADYIKTSTGYGSNGATKEDIKLFQKYIGKNIKIKAAGGIKTLEDAQDFIKLGASRLGTSRIVKIIKEKNSEKC